MDRQHKSPLYTATGDNGTTALIGGTRTQKHAPRIEAYGTTDELNSHIGLLISLLPTDDTFHPIARTLTTIQHQLFNIGAALATPPIPGSHPRAGITPAEIDTLEQAIDRIDSQLPPLRQFILPGGTTAASQAHVARTVCRRAERRITALADQEPVAPETIRYINRLSDLLFAIARTCNVKTANPEILWSKDCQ